MECSYSERHERSQHLKGMMIPLAQRRMGMGRGEVAAAGRREQVETEPSRAQSQAPSNAPVTASQTSEPLLIGKETSSTDADETAPASTRLRPRMAGRRGMAAANASPAAGMAATWLVAST